MEAAVRVIGVGNPLMGDDGFGIVAAERLAAMDLPPQVEVVDGGTGGISLLGLMEGANRVFLIDALDFGAEPGRMLCLSGDRLKSPEAPAALSLHQAGLCQVLALGRELGTLPPVTLYGVQQESVGRRIGLSPAVAAAVDPLVRRICKDLVGT